MKIENSGMTPISPKRTDSIQSSDKKSASSSARVSISGKDRAEVTESARLLAKARTELENADGAENERLEMLKQQVQSGNYEIPVEELAKRLLAKRIFE